MMQANKCIVPIMLKTESGGEQIALAPIANVGDMNKSVVPNIQYVQMKLQPGPDGMFRLAPTQMPPALTLTPQGLQQFGIQPLQTVQTQPTHQQQIQIQPQQNQIQTQTLAMPSVQVPLANYLSLVEKSSQAHSATDVHTSQPSIVISQPHHNQQQQQQTQQQQQPQQQSQPLQIVQRQPVQPQPAKQQVLSSQQQSQLKVQKVNPPVQAQPLPTVIHRKESDPEDHLNSSTESVEGSLTAQSLAATQQMKAISAMSVKQDSIDHGNNTATSGTGTGVSFTACDVCSKSFKRKEHLMQHLKSHVGLRPFKCSESGCNKSFSRKEHLMRHVVSHTGKKLFSCPVCRKYFSRKDNLNKHKK